MVEFPAYDQLDFSRLQSGTEPVLPAICVEELSGRVAMVGFMNLAAYERTLELGKVTFWSRTRQELWTKGETSGNFLELVDIIPDCDADTLLVEVRTNGPVCHRGTDTCFD